MDKKIEIISIPALTDNYIWIIHNTETNLTSVIDPAEAKPVEKVLYEKGWELNQIINTHHHYDHTNGNRDLKNNWKAELIAPKLEEEKIDNIDLKISDGEEINIAGLNASVIHTPGHTLGHLCYFLPDELILFAGDTLFSLGCGRVFEGSHKQMYDSLAKIKKLDAKTTIYSGHEYTLSNAEFAIHVDKNNADLLLQKKEIEKLRFLNKPTLPTTLEIELKCNPFLRSEKKELAKSISMQHQKPEEVFSTLRAMKDNF